LNFDEIFKNLSQKPEAENPEDKAHEFAQKFLKNHFNTSPLDYDSIIQKEEPLKLGTLSEKISNFTIDVGKVSNDFLQKID
jgi:hypothetical protein